VTGLEEEAWPSTRQKQRLRPRQARRRAGATKVSLPVGRVTVGFVWVTLFFSLVLGGCGTTSGRGAQVRNPKVVALVGSGLKEAFVEAGAAFERAHPGVTIELRFGHIPELLAAIDQGMPADLVVGHDQQSIERLVEQGKAAAPPRVLARNELTIVVPAGNPKGITRLVDLSRPGTTTVLCRPELPCGAAAQRVLRAAGVVVSAPLVDGGAAVASRVGRGEADSGIAFRPDIQADRTKVEAVAIPTKEEATAGIPAVVLKGAGRPREAADFLDFLESDAGTTIFRRHGFFPG
jgi:molybdate transport system substrate-binding protein